MFLNWERIRSFGELEVLTKASYIALILVPIIAGLWPSVRVAINHYNKAATEASIIMNVAHDRINKDLTHLKKTALEIKVVSAPLSKALSEYAGKIELEAQQLVEQVSQFKNEFVPMLSIIDVLMFNSPSQVKFLLNEFDLL